MISDKTKAIEVVAAVIEKYLKWYDDEEQDTGDKLFDECYLTSQICSVIARRVIEALELEDIK